MDLADVLLESLVDLIAYVASFIVHILKGISF